MKKIIILSLTSCFILIQSHLQAMEEYSLSPFSRAKKAMAQNIQSIQRSTTQVLDQATQYARDMHKMLDGHALAPISILKQLVKDKLSTLPQYKREILVCSLFGMLCASLLYASKIDKKVIDNTLMYSVYGASYVNSGSIRFLFPFMANPLFQRSSMFLQNCFGINLLLKNGFNNETLVYIIYYLIAKRRLCCFTNRTIVFQVYFLWAYIEIILFKEREQHNIPLLRLAMEGFFSSETEEHYLPRLKFAKFLIWLGTNPNSLGNNAVTPLQCAAQNGYSQLAELLCAQGAAVNRISQAETFAPLVLAVNAGNHNVIKTLLKYKASLFPELSDGTVVPVLEMLKDKRPEIVSPFADILRSELELSTGIQIRDILNMLIEYAYPLEVAKIK
jgi:hypothetical protein